jgi:hypothetical protein
MWRKMVNLYGIVLTERKANSRNATKKLQVKTDRLFCQNAVDCDAARLGVLNSASIME